MTTPAVVVEEPHLSCGGCNNRLTVDNYPVQSFVCGHSICTTCLRTTKQTSCVEAKRSTNATVAASHRDDQLYLPCPICKESRAFHPVLSKPNLTALCAIDLLEQYAEIMRAKAVNKELALTSNHHDKNKAANKDSSLNATTTTTKPPAKNDDKPPPQQASAAAAATMQVNNKDNPQTTGASTTNDNNKNNDGSSLKKAPTAHPGKVPTRIDDTASPTAKSTKTKAKDLSGQQQSPSIGIVSSSESEANEDSSLEPTSPPSWSPPPGGERMVWVNFAAGNQLAWLLEMNEKKATVRWESQKYVSVVEAHRIEELDIGRSKRSRRVSLDYNEQNNTPVARPTKKKTTKKRRKNASSL